MGQKGIKHLVLQGTQVNCKSTRDLAKYFKIHKDVFQLLTLKDGQFKCHFCK